MTSFSAGAATGRRHVKRLVKLVAVVATGALAAVPAIAKGDIVVPPQAGGGSPIAVPPGNQPFLEGHVRTGKGTQIYQCNADGAAWTLLKPEATLSADDGTPIIHHFAGPTWQSLDDGSSVMATRTASMAAPSGGIPWLLLTAKNNALGPEGGDELFPTTYIQRVNTTGGLAPATPCAAGAVKAVPYTADYIFYKAENAQN